MSIGSMIEITDASDPRIGVFLNQKDAWLKAAHNPDAPTDALGDHGAFIAEGVLVVEHLLQSRFPTRSIFVSRSRVPGVEPLLASVPESVPIYVAQQELMDAVVGFPIHRGLLACGQRLPSPDPLELARSCHALIVLEDLSNHDNVGSVFRSAAALGGEGVGVILSARCCDPLYRKALRVSMGHVLRVPFAICEDLPVLMPQLSDLGYTTLALTPSPDAEVLSPSDKRRYERPALCFGAEGPGLSEALMRAANHRVRIEMASGVDSLNISVAAAVSMYACLSPRMG
ncbi:MAG: RNA methyltransferase [Phycisphaerales bacterium]